MTFTKIAVAGGVVLLGFACFLAAAGFGVAREGVISLVALVVLVGGGNLLSGRGGPYGRRSLPTTGPSPGEPDARGTGGASDEHAQ